MLSLNTILLQGFLREVFQIECHDGVSATKDCSSKHMPILRVRKHKATDQRFVTRDQAITNMEVHQVSDMLDLFTPNIVMILDDIPHPFFVNIIGPPRVI